MGVTRPLPERFWEKVHRGDGCWEWQAFVQPNSGYGTITVDGKSLRAHRVSYELNIGPIPVGLHVLHTCDNPRCVRPDHLFTGNQGDNVRDMHAKGRHRGGNRPGEGHPQAKLTDADVAAIRQRYLPRDGSGAQIMREYGISSSHLSHIVSRKLWRHVA